MLITYPLTQPDQPRWPTFGCFHSTGLQFDAYTVSSRGLSATKRGGNCTTRGSDTPTTRPLKASCSAKPPPPPTSCAALHPRPAQGELFRARAHIRLSRATNFAHRTQKHGDVETDNTTARPNTGPMKPTTPLRPKYCTKDAHFSPAKAMTVSTVPPHRPAKAMTVSIPHRHKQAKAIAVSNHRANSPATPRRSARGRLLAAVPVGGGRAWPDTKTTRRTTRQHTRPHRCGRRRENQRAWLRCTWAAGPGRATSRRAEPHVGTASTAGVEGAGGTGGHGRASRRGAERSEAA